MTLEIRGRGSFSGAGHAASGTGGRRLPLAGKGGWTGGRRDVDQAGVEETARP